MIENRNSVLTNVEALQPAGIEATWVGPELSAEQVEIRGKRILLVEDEEPLRACVRMMLEFAGHQVTEATNGAEGWNLFSTGEYDLVITDFEMPVMAGNRLAIGIKLLAPSLPILMITACERARRDVKNPVDVLLNKPFTVVDLHCALQQLFLFRSEPAQPAVVRDTWQETIPSEFVGAPADSGQHDTLKR
jgi:CheY-like chemotaxis protein